MFPHLDTTMTKRCSEMVEKQRKVALADERILRLPELIQYQLLQRQRTGLDSSCVIFVVRKAQLENEKLKENKSYGS